MSIEYVLKIDALGNFPKIIIDELRFLKLKTSKEILSEALAIEEKWLQEIRSRKIEGDTMPWL